MIVLTEPVAARALVAVLALVSAAGASFDSDMDSLARSMAEGLELSPAQVLSITTIVDDRTYMLSLDPVYRVLRRKLEPFVREVRFNAFRGHGSATMRAIILSGNREYAPPAMPEKQLDSLILTGAYFLIPGQSEHINVSLAVTDMRGRTVFDSDEYLIAKADCPAALRRDIFALLADPETLGRLQYKGELIDNLDRLFHGANNNLLAYPAEYRFVTKCPYAVRWQTDMLSEVLSLKYGMCFVGDGPNAVIVQPGGSVAFEQDGRRREIEGIVDIGPILPDSFPEERDSLFYACRTGDSGATLEKKAFETTGERKVRDAIHRTFSQLYPELFREFDETGLRRVFASEPHPSVLVGRRMVSDQSTGREQVAYRWYSSSQWLDELSRAHAEWGRTFDVTTSVMAVFNDNIDPRRYWAIVLQKWRTRDRYGVAVYEDRGFLVVNFDFDAGARLKEFRIHYRLWFYDYQYDDVELGIRRHEKLLHDIDTYFVDNLGGIDTVLKMQMKNFLVQKVRNAALGGNDRL